MKLNNFHFSGDENDLSLIIIIIISNIYFAHSVCQVPCSVLHIFNICNVDINITPMLQMGGTWGSETSDGWPITCSKLNALVLDFKPRSLWLQCPWFLSFVLYYTNSLHYCIKWERMSPLWWDKNVYPVGRIN